MSFEYIVSRYGVPACAGRRVLVSEKPGIIVQAIGHRVGITLDEDKPGNIGPYHPADMSIEYLDEIGKIRPMTRSQGRYQDFLKEADCWDDFGHYLRNEISKRDH